VCRGCLCKRLPLYAAGRTYGITVERGCWLLCALFFCSGVFNSNGIWFLLATARSIPSATTWFLPLRPASPLQLYPNGEGMRSDAGFVQHSLAFGSLPA